LDSNISLNDKLVGTDADDNSITKNYSIDSLGDGLISLKNIITGGGTLNTIPLFTPDGQKIDDSIITQNALGTTIAVNGIFTVDNALTVANGGDTNVIGDLEVESNLTVDGLTILNDNLTVQGSLVANDPVTINSTLTVSNSAFMNGALTVEGASTFNDEAVFNNQAVFESDANFQSSISDEASSTGTAGQVLSSTGAAVRWIDNLVLTSPGGTDYRIVVDDAGVLSTVEV
jgi:hypothetical protein